MFGERGPSFWELARQAMSSTTDGYDLLAPKFDETPFRTPDPIMAAVAERAGDAEAAIDLCCGTGAAFPHLAPRTRRLVGIDFSPGMLRIAGERARALGIDVELAEHDVLSMDERDYDGAFDLATCFGAFGHILPRDEPRFVRVIHRLLRPGGHFVFATAVMPSPASASYLVAKAFNAAMHVRNALWRPPFVMYYLTFTLPDCARLLEAEGFAVEVHDAGLGGLRIVSARRSPA